MITENDTAKAESKAAWEALLKSNPASPSDAVDIEENASNPLDGLWETCATQSAEWLQENFDGEIAVRLIHKNARSSEDTATENGHQNFVSWGGYKKSGCYIEFGKEMRALVTALLLGADLNFPLFEAADEATESEIALAQYFFCSVIETLDFGDSIPDFPQWVALETTPNFQKELAPFERAWFEISLGANKAGFTFGFSRNALQSEIFASAKVESHPNLNEPDVKLRANVVMQGSPTTLSQLESWKTGDLLPLGSISPFAGQLRVGDNTIFSGRIGRSENTFCFQIGQLIDMPLRKELAMKKEANHEQF